MLENLELYKDFNDLNDQIKNVRDSHGVYFVPTLTYSLRPASPEAPTSFSCVADLVRILAAFRGVAKNFRFFLLKAEAGNTTNTLHLLNPHFIC